MIKNCQSPAFSCFATARISRYTARLNQSRTLPRCKLTWVPAPVHVQKTRPVIARFGVFEADLEARELRKQGRRLRLQDQPFSVLAFLLERAGNVVTREELREKLWPADTFVDFDHSL